MVRGARTSRHGEVLRTVAPDVSVSLAGGGGRSSIVRPPGGGTAGGVMRVALVWIPMPGMTFGARDSVALARGIGARDVFDPVAGRQGERHTELACWLSNGPVAVGGSGR